LPFAASRAQGCHVWDTEGRKHLDFMSAYSAVSLGHSHPELVSALARQAGRLAVTSRAYHNDQLPLFLKELCLATGYAKALPMNSGAEAVETAIKAARKWGTSVKGIPDGRCRIVVCSNNFHGRTTAIVGFSSEPQYKQGFGPFAGGFDIVPYGDAQALAAAIGDDTCAFLFEPIQGEAGIVVPPIGYLKEAARLCRERDVLLLADEIQTGFGRTGIDFAYRREIDKVDGLILGKALGGGLLPVSALVGSQELLGVFAPGDHGSTFGGNPLACAVARAALPLLMDPELSARSHRLGEHLLGMLRRRLAGCPFLVDIRGQGLFCAIEVSASVGARGLAEQLLGLGVITKETHGTVLRLAPPLIVGEADLSLCAQAIAVAFDAKACEMGTTWRSQPR
jgi:ornithine--oxo-acid transaminase